MDSSLHALSLVVLQCPVRISTVAITESVSRASVAAFMGIPAMTVPYWCILNAIIDVRDTANTWTIQYRCAYANTTGRDRTVPNVSDDKPRGMTLTAAFAFLALVVKCHVDCGTHGDCSVENRHRCQCHEGWTGDTCTKKLCPAFCQQCDDDGLCLCPNGFTGRFCQIGETYPCESRAEALTGLLFRCVSEQLPRARRVSNKQMHLSSELVRIGM